MMRDLYNALPLPDDRPITSLCVVEDLAGCPPNYTTVSKTHDQDIDADLYKDGFFRRVTRYMCHSKTEGYMGYVVVDLSILPDRDSRQAGFTLIEQTIDSSQKAFKKKQLAYKQVPRNMATQTITDIIILSRSKVAPEGFSLVGEMNGLCICYKPGPPPTPQSNKQLQGPSPVVLPYGVNPGARGSIGSAGEASGLYPGLSGPSPVRPAPYPPSAGPSPPPVHALFGVPFVMNKKYVKSSNDSSSSSTLPAITKKSRQQIEDEYYYSFTLEQDSVSRPTT